MPAQAADSGELVVPTRGGRTCVNHRTARDGRARRPQGGGKSPCHGRRRRCQTSRVTGRGRQGARLRLCRAAGFNRSHAILGASDHCVATYPSDVAVALEARVQLPGPDGERSLPFADFLLRPGKTPDREQSLRQGELITAVEIPAYPRPLRSGYVKVRDRQSSRKGRREERRHLSGEWNIQGVNSPPFPTCDRCHAGKHDQQRAARPRAASTARCPTRRRPPSPRESPRGAHAERPPPRSGRIRREARRRAAVPARPAPDLRQRPFGPPRSAPPRSVAVSRQCGGPARRRSFSAKVPAAQVASTPLVRRWWQGRGSNGPCRGLRGDRGGSAPSPAVPGSRCSTSGRQRRGRRPAR